LSGYTLGLYNSYELIWILLLQKDLEGVLTYEVVNEEGRAKQDNLFPILADKCSFYYLQVKW
jgi:hypothetical protein